MTREFDPAADPAVFGNRMRELMFSVTFDTITADTEAMLAHVDADPAVDSSKIGAVGYWTSGPFAYAVAGIFPDRILSAASFYEVRLHGKGAPDHLAAAMKGDLYFGCAELDEYAPMEMIDGLEAHLRSVGANVRVEWYPGAHHGFAFPRRAGL